PQLTIATAITYLHRFYMRRTLYLDHHFDVGGACVLLACKTEESIRKVREIAISCAKSATKNRRLTDEGEFEKWGHTITKKEVLVSTVLCFNYNILHPYVPM
ncbi:21208_t:CDS:2, partial [Dentiscutata erythropus]